MDQRWFKWAAYAVAALVVLSFALPVLSPFFGSTSPRRNNDAPDDVSALPDFILPAADGGDLRLIDRAASYSNIVLVFHQGFECAACRAQLTELQTGYTDLRNEGTEIIAIGLDDELDTQRLAQQVGVRFPMLYDESGAVASSYGVREQLFGEYTTAVLILNRDLQLILNPVGTTGDQLLPVAAIIAAIREANGNGVGSGTSS